MFKRKFKVGDEVNWKGNQDIEIIEDIDKNGNIKTRYDDGDLSKVYAIPKHFTLVEEALMNLKSRIEALTGWDKTADDILMEL